MRHDDDREIPDERSLWPIVQVTEKAEKRAANLEKILFDKKWRADCFKRVEKKFPAIITYLTQLLAHDVTHSARANTRFELVSGRFETGNANLRTSGLLLHTIYGEGLQLDSQLYKNRQKDGQLDPSFDLPEIKLNVGSRVLPGFWLPTHQAPPLRALSPILGDTRNGDTPMLLWIAVEFMKFHNKLIVTHTKLNKASRTQPRRSQQQIFEAARIEAVLTWHNIIENDVLPAVTSHSNPRGGVPHATLRNDLDMFHGLMRAFHTLPLNGYLLKRGKLKRVSLTELLAPTATMPEFSEVAELKVAYLNAMKRWHEKWRVDFDQIAGGSSRNCTCFTPSFAENFGFTPVGKSVKTSILRRDMETARRIGVSPVKEYPELEAPTRNLLKKLSKIPKVGDLPYINEVPLSFGFLAEAYYSNERTGALGPLGAAAFSTAVITHIDEIQTYFSTQFGRVHVEKMKAKLPNDFNAMMAYSTH